MIFVTVGTHEQGFERLVKEIDKIAESGELFENIKIQIGYTSYIPKNCEWKKFVSYDEMERNIEEASIIVTHGGPASFLQPLQHGKIPIVVPRQKKFNEHVNDHQLEFVRVVEKELGNILVVENVEDLRNTILKYDSLIKNMGTKCVSHNAEFIRMFEKSVNEIMK